MEKVVYRTGENRKKFPYRVQAVERALDILDCFTFESKELGLFEIAEKTGLNKTTAKRMLANLSFRNYLQQDPKTMKYRLGMRLFEMGGIVSSSFSLLKTAGHHMEALQKASGATVLLGMMMDEQLVYIDKREGTGVIRISSEIGWRRPIHYGMLGMVLCAYQEPPEVARMLKKYPLEAYTPHSITSQEKFMDRLKEIRKQGYVRETGEAVEGVVGIAAPLWDSACSVVAALGVAFPARETISADGTADLAQRVKETCATISAEIGYGSVEKRSQKRVGAGEW
jgi:DNA-binding IclR family transcriptional regulator